MYHTSMKNVLKMYHKCIENVSQMYHKFITNVFIQIRQVRGSSENVTNFFHQHH